MVIHKTRPPRRRTVNERDSGERNGWAAWSATFFVGVLQWRLLTNFGQQAGHKLVGGVLHRLMDFDFDRAEAGGVVVQALRPAVFQVVQLLVDAGNDFGERHNDRLGCGIRVNEHGKSSVTQWK